ncbi:late control protein D [Pseudomonas sp. BN515]|uniref:phage late control D family protein n=1 Tax=Pseudomonas sp. BN515 TaxID=2567892 RepID=UPI002458DD82|nr:late control protein D [Pseudomonas sp. BN515]MDH4869805.1 late control protein D [Pseudomonas sp. BN515]
MDALNENQVPSAYYSLNYQNRNITRDISEYLLELEYVDFLTGQSDELNVTLEDSEGKWIDAWYPGHGDTLTLSVGWTGQAARPLGSFEIDEIEIRLRPSVVTIRALAASINSAVRTQRHQAYENTTLAAVAAQVATRQGLQLVGRIEPIKLDRVTQQEGDLAFLAQLAEEYDYAFKIVGRRLVFHAIADLAAARPVATVSLDELEDVMLRDQIKQVPAKATVKHKDPASKKLVSYTIENGETVAVPSSASQATTSADTKKRRSRSTSAEVAKAKAKAELAKANRERTTGNWSMMGRPYVVSGNVLALQAPGVLGGNYLVMGSRHRFTRAGGYTSEQEVCRVTAPAIALTLDATKPDQELIAYGIDNRSTATTA